MTTGRRSLSSSSCKTVRVRVRVRFRARARARARVRARVREHGVAKRVPTEKATLRSRSVNLGCHGTRYVRHARGWNACDLHTVVTLTLTLGLG